MTGRLLSWALALFSGHAPLLAGLAVIGALGSGYWAGDHQRNNAWLAKQAAVERQAHEAYVAEVARSNVAARGFETDYAALTKSFSTLEDQFNAVKSRTPLVVYRAGRARPAVPGAVAGLAPPRAPAGAGQPAPAHPGAPPDGPDAQPGADAAADMRLSLGAVWLWNSALTGTSTPAGACNPADAAAEACAADAGVAIDAAFANHAENAKTCAIDRLRHQRLIDYINAYNKGQPTP